MAKKQIQKNINKHKMNEDYQKEDNFMKQLRSLLILLGSIVIVFAISYLITGFFITKEFRNKNDNNNANTNNKDNTPVEIQYEEITYGSTFNMKEKEYYVIFIDFKDNTKSLIDQTVRTYKAKEDSIPVYYVDLSNRFNESIKSDIENKDAKNSSELKIKETTIIKIKEKNNVLYKSNIINVVDVLK